MCHYCYDMIDNLNKELDDESKLHMNELLIHHNYLKKLNYHNVLKSIDFARKVYIDLHYRIEEEDDMDWNLARWSVTDIMDTFDAVHIGHGRTSDYFDFMNGKDIEWDFPQDNHIDIFDIIINQN